MYYNDCKTNVWSNVEPVFIHPHATKLGLTEKQILHAWTNAIEVARRDGNDGVIDYVAIGFDQDGRPIEMTANWKPAGFLIYHANTPPTPRAFEELGLTRR